MALRVAFFGTPGFAVPTLEQLVQSPHPVVGVVTQPDRPRGRGQQVTMAPVKALAVSLGLAVLQPERLARDQFQAAFTDLQADIGVVAAYGKILPDWLLATPSRGLINVHASLLPRYRGASPVQRAVIAGDAETGVTIMRVVTTLDAGPVLSSVRILIGPDDTSAVVESTLATRGAELLIATLDDLEVGRATETAQDESQVTYAPKLTKADGLVDWRRPARDVHNLVRGLWPWPHAFTFLDDIRVILHRSRLSPLPALSPPGTILAASTAEGLHVACGDGAVEIVDLQLEGKRVINARTFVAGGSLAVGARFLTP